MTPEELRRRTEDFAADVSLFLRPLFQRIETRNAACQLDDAASAVGANYRTAGRSRSRKEFVSRISVVLEEADESAYWLAHLLRTADTDRAQAKRLLNEASQLVSIFSASVGTARRGLESAKPDARTRRRMRPRRSAPDPHPGNAPHKADDDVQNTSDDPGNGSAMNG